MFCRRSGPLYRVRDLHYHLFSPFFCVSFFVFTFSLFCYLEIQNVFSLSEHRKIYNPTSSSQPSIGAFRRSHIGNSGDLQWIYQADNLLSTLDLEYFRIVKFWEELSFAEDLSADTVSDSRQFGAFHISQFWIRGAFSEDLPSRQLAFTRGFGVSSD